MKRRKNILSDSKATQAILKRIDMELHGVEFDLLLLPILQILQFQVMM